MSLGRRELLILGGVAGAAALAGGIAGALYLQWRNGAGTLLSSEFPDLTGRARRISEWQGRALLCNFWATWCAPCREELPLLDAAQQQHGTARFQVLGIGIDTAPNIREYLKVVNISFPVLVGEYSALALMRELGNRNGGLPFSVLLDSSGRVRDRRLGAYSALELSAEVGALLR
jgi:thiol-disulfide isomerase/thioredoxin